VRFLILGILFVGISSIVSAGHHEEDEGALVYQANCAYCHEREMVRMPNREDLKKRDALEVYSTISSGVMAPYTRDLSHEERRLVTEYVTGKSLGDYASGAAAIPAEAYCDAALDGKVTQANSGWNSWGNDSANTRYQTSDNAGLSKSDVPNLKYKWAFGVPGVSSMSGQPAVADGRLYFGTWSGLVIALDAESGCALWVYEASGGIRTAMTLGELKNGTISLFFGDLSGRAYSLDPNTGTENWTIQADDHDHARITGTPVYHDNRLYIPLSSLEEVAGSMHDYECCTFRGGVMSVDADNGKTLWKTRTIAEVPSKRGKNSVGTQLWAPSGAAVWTAPTVDPETRSIYVVTGDSYSVPAAPESDAVMAFDMDTGDIKWTTQTLAGDAFTVACITSGDDPGCPENHGPDLDFGSSPVLTTNAQGERLLLAGQKSGWLYALNPNDGSLKWKIEVGPGGIVGGIEWGFAVDSNKAYVAIAGAWELGPGEAGSISAINLNTGKIVWKTGPSKTVCNGIEKCNTGQLAAVTALDGVVFSGSLDGHLRAYDSETGKIIWEYNTLNTYSTVNGVKAVGGSINGPGPAIAQGHVYVNSGYGMWNMWIPGNALIALSVNGE